MEEQNNTIINLNKTKPIQFKQQEIKFFNSANQMIFGVAYIPVNEAIKRFPLLIISHGLGDSYDSHKIYAVQFAIHDIAVFCFDFCGGGGEKSDGSSTSMSVMTEVSDLEAVLKASEEWDFVDSTKIFLFGHSQGGMVSAITAARHSKEIYGVFLLAPSFSLTNLLHKMFESIEKVPGKFHFLYIDAGKIYAEDIWNYNVYSEIGKYKRKVLLIHGSADDLVPIEYSERAKQFYQDSELIVIDGAGHEFKGDEINKTIDYILRYLFEIGIVNYI